MKKVFIVLLLAMVLLTGCVGIAANSNKNTSDLSGDDYIADGMTVTEENDKEFYLMRAGDIYLEVPGKCNWVYTEGEGEYPNLENGQIAYLKADVSIYSGGEDGYCGNIFIREIKSCEVVEYLQLVKDVNVPELFQNEFSYEEHMLAYQDETETYLAVMCGAYTYLYEDGVLVNQYDHSTKASVICNDIDRENKNGN